VQHAARHGSRSLPAPHKDPVWTLTNAIAHALSGAAARGFSSEGIQSTSLVPIGLSPVHQVALVLQEEVDQVHDQPAYRRPGHKVVKGG
jgi:hypothetical protein